MHLAAIKSRRRSLGHDQRRSVVATNDPGEGSLRGVILGYHDRAAIAKEALNVDVIGGELLPLIHSEFEDRDCLDPRNPENIGVDRIHFEGSDGHGPEKYNDAPA